MSLDVASPKHVVSGFPGHRSAQCEGGSRTEDFSRTEGLVPPYAQLRNTLASRDRSLRRKVM
jgi:hypothetical protein